MSKATERDLFEWHAANALQQSVFPNKTVNAVQATIAGLRDGPSYDPAFPRLLGMWDGWLISKQRHQQVVISACKLVQGEITMQELATALEESGCVTLSTLATVELPPETP